MIGRGMSKWLRFPRILPAVAIVLCIWCLKMLSNPRSEEAFLIVFSMARSGSSFLGEMLSTSDKSIYFFEPLKAIRSGDSDLARWSVVDKSRIVPLLRGLFNCDEEELKRLGDTSETSALDRNLQKCRQSNIRVIKTVRLRRKDLLSLLQTSDKPIKVVHLVRDPRARASSMKRAPGLDFGEVMNKFTESCDWALDDLNLEDELDRSSYYRVRYEDLVMNPIQVIESIHDFMQIAFTEETKRQIEQHVSGEKAKKTSFGTYKDEYYSTYRSKSFDPFSWKKDLGKDLLNRINDKCESLIKKLDYEVDF